jgi:hypothetical protein
MICIGNIVAFKGYFSRVKRLKVHIGLAMKFIRFSTTTPLKRRLLKQRRLLSGVVKRCGDIKYRDIKSRHVTSSHGETSSHET